MPKLTDGVHGELNAAPAYGDFAHGAPGTFIKMPAGFVRKVHMVDVMPSSALTQILQRDTGLILNRQRNKPWSTTRCYRSFTQWQNSRHCEGL